MALQAAQVSHAVLLAADQYESNSEQPVRSLEQSLAQLNAFVESSATNTNLVDALNKVISTLSTGPRGDQNAQTGSQPRKRKNDES